MSKLDEMLKEADAEEAQKTRQLEQVTTNKELYPEHLKSATAKATVISADIERLFQVVLGAKPNGNPLPDYNVEEDFNPTVSSELHQRLDDAHKALVGSRGSVRRFVPSTSSTPLASWLLPLVGVFVALGIAGSTDGWFVNDWVEIHNDDLAGLATVFWWLAWIALGFFGIPKLFDVVKGRFRSSG